MRWPWKKKAPVVIGKITKTETYITDQGIMVKGYYDKVLDINEVRKDMGYPNYINIGSYPLQGDPHDRFEVSSSYDGDMGMVCLTHDCYWAYDAYDPNPVFGEYGDLELGNLNRVAGIHTRAPFTYTVENKCLGSFEMDSAGRVSMLCKLCGVDLIEHP